MKQTDSDPATEEIEVLGFAFHDKWGKYNASDYPIYNPELTIEQLILAEAYSIKEIRDKRGRPMAFIKIQPYGTVATELVMFANNYKPIKEGIYAMQIRNGNQLIDFALANRA
jgi:hypothetical protein